jgi:RNA polymerase-binding transcription factor DksA
MPGRKPTQSDLDAYEEQLRLMLGVLRGDISQLEAESISQASADRQGDDGDSYSLEVSLELLQRGGSTANDILEAFGRIAEGTFGRCSACERWIKKERLLAIPYTSHCIECQRQAEAG